MAALTAALILSATPLAAQPTGNHPKVVVNRVIERIPVYGDNYDQLKRSILESVYEKCELDDALACIRWSSSLDFDYDSTATNCRLKNVVVTGTAKIFVPKLAERRPTRQVVNAWKRLEKIAFEHEFRHEEIYRKYAVWQANALSKIEAATCQDVSLQGAIRKLELELEARTAQEAFHRSER